MKIFKRKMSQLNITIPTKLRNKYKSVCAEWGTSMQENTTKLIEQWINRREMDLNYAKFQEENIKKQK